MSVPGSDGGFVVLLVAVVGDGAAACVVGRADTVDEAKGAPAPVPEQAVRSTRLAITTGAIRRMGGV